MEWVDIPGSVRVSLGVEQGWRPLQCLYPTEPRDGMAVAQVGESSSPCCAAFSRWEQKGGNGIVKAIQPGHGVFCSAIDQCRACSMPPRCSSFVPSHPMCLRYFE